MSGCLDFDGTDDVVTVTNADAIDLNVGLAAGFTISSWIYADTDGEGDVGQIWQKGTTSYCRVDSQVGSNLDVECSLDLATTDATLNISAPITTAAWNHIAVTWSDDADDEITIWINGYNRGSSTNGDGAPAADTNNLLIGGTTTANFDGKIDEFRVYSAELSASEILIDANAGSASAMGGVLGTQDSEGSGGNPPIAWWKIDENTGTSIADTSGNGNTVTASGATWTSGKVGQALSFDGSNDYMNTSSTISFGVKVITLTFWLKWDAFADDNKLAFELSTNYNNNDGSIIVNPDNSSNPSTFNLSIQDSVTTSKYRQENFTRPSAGEWHHYAAVFDNSTVTGDIKLYLDGVEQSSTLATNDKDQSSNIRTDTLYFMSRAGTSLFGAGDLDDVKIYDYERTAAQIAYDYNRGGPLAWWKFDECQGNAAYSSGSLNLSGGIITPGTAGNTTVGTCSSGTTTEMWDDGTTGKLNSAIGTDGSDDYVSVTDTANLRFDDSTADFSLFAWVKRTTTGTEYIISKEDADNDGWRLQFNSSNQVLCSEDATDVTGSLAISDTNWHHIGCTIDRDGNGQVYVDGRADGTATSISADAMATTSNVVIATRSYTPTSYFSGLIDDVRLYNYVLTADQVKRVMLGSDHGSAQRFGPDTGSP
ncbi:MAG: LamG domain-containing protein [Candidatus Chisholmbacteria bacterium]|nr:LamG domain-containing protein [Candidatus Chisholmbacteria bacterium]